MAQGSQVHSVAVEVERLTRQGWSNPMKTRILVALIALSLGVVTANAQSQQYRAPAHNFYQNNWMGGGGG
jgi:hypothetical protein